MKKLLLLASIATFMFATSCNNASTAEGTHKHEDGSTHTDHADTTKPAQQEFKVADTTKTDTSTHKHANGEKHSH
jgi:hypothetical protein